MNKFILYFKEVPPQKASWQNRFWQCDVMNNVTFMFIKIIIWEIISYDI